jgi:hypothetical protein
MLLHQSVHPDTSTIGSFLHAGMMSLRNLVSAKSGVNELDLRINDLGASESTSTEVFLRGSTRMFNQSIPSQTVCSEIRVGRTAKLVLDR